MVIGGIAALALSLAPVALAAPPGGTPSGAVKRFVVNGVYTREQRSMLVAEGYDIGEAAWVDHVELFGSDRQARALALRGLQVVQPMQVNDFPPEDSNYHNYRRWSPTSRRSRRHIRNSCTSSRSASPSKDAT